MHDSPAVSEGRPKSRNSHQKTKSQSVFNISKQSPDFKTPRYRSDSSESEEEERKGAKTPSV